MKTTLSKQVLAWGDGLIHDYVLDVLKRRRKRSPGDEYSTKQEDNIHTKLVQVPEVGMGNPTRDINHERTQGDVPEFSSYNQADYEIYGADVPQDDETKPGGGRRISPKGEPPVTTHEQTQLLSDDPVAINNLFHPSTQERDQKPSAKTRKLLDSLYNKEPVRFKHRTFSVDALH